MRSIDLPGPLVFATDTTAHPDDIYGGMSVTDMAAAVGAIDPTAGLLTAFAGRRIHAVLTGSPESLFAEDPRLSCCADTTSLLAHRIDAHHIAMLHADMINEAVADEQASRIGDGDPDACLLRRPGRGRTVSARGLAYSDARLRSRQRACSRAFSPPSVRAHSSDGWGCWDVVEESLSAGADLAPEG